MFTLGLQSYIKKNATSKALDSNRRETNAAHLEIIQHLILFPYFVGFPKNH